MNELKHKMLITKLPHPQHHKQMLILENKMNKRRVNNKSQDWIENYITIVQEKRLEKNGKVETKMVNKLSLNITLCNVTELNELIYGRAKLVCDKIGVPLRNTNKNTNSGLEIRLDELVNKLRQQAKMLRKEKKTREYIRMKKQKKKYLKAINQTIWVKEGRL